MLTTKTAPTPYVDAHIHRFKVQLYMDHLVLAAELVSPEMRLSDQLNSSLPWVDILPGAVRHLTSGAFMDLAGAHGPVNKSKLRLVVPVSEPERPQGPANFAWKKTVQRACWISLGSYTLTGTIHTDAAGDPRMALRALDKQFIPITDVTLAFSDGYTEQRPVVIVNRENLDLIALRDDPMSWKGSSPYLPR